jgi:hypothetical protein
MTELQFATRLQSLIIRSCCPFVRNSLEMASRYRKRALAAADPTSEPIYDLNAEMLAGISWDVRLRIGGQMLVMPNLDDFQP